MIRSLFSPVASQGRRAILSTTASSYRSPSEWTAFHRSKSTSARESALQLSLPSQAQHAIQGLWNTPPSAETPVPALSLKDLVEHIPQAIHHQKEQGIKPGSPADALSIMMERVQVTPKDLREYAFFDTTRRYTRNLISTDNETYTLLLLCWNPYQESPIHNHPCDGCFLRVVQGHIRECRYREATSSTGALSSLIYHESTTTNDQSKSGPTRTLLECTHDSIFEAGQMTFIDDTQGYHKVGPVGKTPAITLHLYTPPFQECRTWADPPAADGQYGDYFL